jgi:uncharacterized protein involved in tolerance to divalent cations
MAESILLVLCSIPDSDTLAREIAAALLEQKLAACVHCLPAGLSIYVWKGEREEQRERILQTAGEIDQRRELEPVVDQHQERIPADEPLAGRKAELEQDVQECGERDNGKVEKPGKLEAEAPVDPEHGDGLPGNRHPAQANDGLQPQTTAVDVDLVVHGQGRSVRVPKGLSQQHVTIGLFF